jgi:hypothetical protein
MISLSALNSYSATTLLRIRGEITAKSKGCLNTNHNKSHRTCPAEASQLVQVGMGGDLLGPRAVLAVSAQTCARARLGLLSLPGGFRSVVFQHTRVCQENTLAEQSRLVVRCVVLVPTKIASTPLACSAGMRTHLSSLPLAATATILSCSL